jgi:hypothetical protein
VAGVASDSGPRPDGLGRNGDEGNLPPDAVRVLGDQYFWTTGDLFGERGSGLLFTDFVFGSTTGSALSLDDDGSADADSTTVGADDDVLYGILGGSALRCVGANPEAVGITTSTVELVVSAVAGYRTAEGLFLPPRLETAYPVTHTTCKRKRETHAPHGNSGPVQSSLSSQGHRSNFRGSASGTNQRFTRYPQECTYK